MKILYTNFHTGDGGGHTTYIRSLAQALAGDHEVHVAAPAGSRLLREATALTGVQALEQPFPNGLRAVLAGANARARLRAHLRRHRFDIVHVNGSADHRLVLAALRGLDPRPRLILTRHNSKPVHGIGHALRARRTDLVIAVSRHTLHQLQSSAYARCRLLAIHNGIDTDHYAPLDAIAARRTFGLPEQALVLSSSAGTAAYKGWMDLVEALAMLPPATRRQVHLLIAGKPIDPARRQRIDALGLAAQVHFPGLLTDVRPVIAAGDAGFVLSHAVETISFACREMMAMGKPVLVSDYAGLAENIDPGYDGWVVPARDRAAIAAHIQTLLSERAHLPMLGAAAREHAERAFGLGTFVAATVHAYQQALTAA